MDSRDGGGAAARGRARRGPLPRRLLGHRRPRRPAPRGLAQGAGGAAGEARGEKRGRGRPRKGEERPRDRAREIKGLRHPLLKNPEDLTEGQAATLAELKRAGTALWRGYLLKEGLRAVFRAAPADAPGQLDGWLSWACRCRIPQFVEFSRKVRRKKEAILRSISLGVSNARVEAVNNKIKVAIRQGYGFRNVNNLIAIVILRCSDLRPTLPGRKEKGKKE